MKVMSTLLQRKSNFYKLLLKSKWWPVRNSNPWMLPWKGSVLSHFTNWPKKMAPQLGLEPRTPWLTVKCSNQLSYWGIKMVGLTGLEPVTSRLSSERSNQLSYKPVWITGQFNTTTICYINQALFSKFVIYFRLAYLE